MLNLGLEVLICFHPMAHVVHKTPRGSNHNRFLKFSVGAGLPRVNKNFAIAFRTLMPNRCDGPALNLEYILYVL